MESMQLRKIMLQVRAGTQERRSASVALPKYIDPPQKKWRQDGEWYYVYASIVINIIYIDYNSHSIYHYY